MFIKDCPTFIAGEPLEARRMAKINTGVTDTVPPTIVYCGVTGIPHMVTQYSRVTSEKIACDMFPFGLAVYEVEVTVSTAIVVGTTLYMAANGMLTDHKTTNAYGVAIAWQQAAASGDHIAVMPLGFTYVTGA